MANGRVSPDSYLFFVALCPKSTARVMSGRSVHLTTPFPGQAWTSSWPVLHAHTFICNWEQSFLNENGRETCLKRPQWNDQKLVFKTDYRLMKVKSIAECSKRTFCNNMTFIKLSFVIKTIVLSIFEWPLKTGFTIVQWCKINIDSMCGWITDWSWSADFMRNQQIWPRSYKTFFWAWNFNCS